MPVLKYWNGWIWQQVGGPDLGPGFVPLTGGTISGNLIVDTGSSWETQVMTYGSFMNSGIITTTGGFFDGNIRFTKLRSAKFGGARLELVGPPKKLDSIATKTTVDTILQSPPKLTAVTPHHGWQAWGGTYGPPGHRLSADGAFVTLEGVFRATTLVIPEGEHSPELFVLPADRRPVGDITLMVIGGADQPYVCTIRADDGRVMLTAGPSIEHGEYLSLDGCRFPIN